MGQQVVDDVPSVATTQAAAPTTRSTTRTAVAVHSAGAATRAAPATMTSAASQPVSTQTNQPKRFDINEYTRTAMELNSALREFNVLVESTDKLIGSPQWNARISEVNKAAEDRVRQASKDSQAVIDLIFQRTIAGAAIIFGMALLYRVIITTLLRRKPAKEAA
jgi:hypothetical protein